MILDKRQKRRLKRKYGKMASILFPMNNHYAKLYAAQSLKDLLYLNEKLAEKLYKQIYGKDYESLSQTF